jgi:hypothetical protein
MAWLVSSNLVAQWTNSMEREQKIIESNTFNLSYLRFEC